MGSTAKHISDADFEFYPYAALETIGKVLPAFLSILASPVERTLPCVLAIATPYGQTGDQ